MNLTNLKNKINNFSISQHSKLVQADIIADTKKRKWRRIGATIKRGESNKREHQIYTGGKDSDISSYLHRGTRRHFIKPKDKKALHWMVGGKGFYSKGHFVSAIKATNFFSISDSTRRKMQSITHKYFTT